MIPKHYHFREIEKKVYDLWLKGDYFQPFYSQSGELLKKTKTDHQKFVIVIPPPNVTGRLHMGHALNNTIQDMLIRYKRMKGFDTLWIPGTDHAGIATQTVVKKMLDEKGIDYRNIGRESFTEKVWEWKEKFGNIILDQLKSLGVSCDWSRTRYTMDEGLSKAVNHAFKKLYDQGYIYRAERIVNWCPVDKTALSDDEVEIAEGGEAGFLYDIAYLLKDGKGEELVVSTSRPETIFGDVALAVHPEDDRFKEFIGKEVILPLTFSKGKDGQPKTIPVIADEYVDREFGTGCLKITPAHDPNDFEIGKKHGFTPINILNEDATLNNEVPEPYQNLDRFKCRKQVLQDLEKANLLRGKRERMIPLGRSYRSKEIIEYRLSMQWFVKMTPLAKKVLERKDELQIHPSNYNKLWNHWLTNIKDWCISRQIWWGHQIPAWFNNKTGEVLVETEEPEQVKKNPQDWTRDPDVLDTWFSSALWPMSTMGWPQPTSDFEKYFPTSALSTAKDIIFFWVARMCLMSIFFEDKMPFSDVYFHPTVMDHHGKIMSKSKGNGLDPQHIINGATVEELKAPALDARPSNMEQIISEIEKKYSEGFIGVGGDALRYTLIHLSSNMQFLQLSLDNFLELGRRFSDKLWNASRLILMHLENMSDFKDVDTTHDFTRSIEDLWMEDKCRQALIEVELAMEKFDFSKLGNIYYDLVWNDFCDWYLEVLKIRLEDPAQNKLAMNSLIVIFEKILILLHPLIPFITEEIYLMLQDIASKRNLSLRSNDLLVVSSFLNHEDFSFLAKEKNNSWNKEFSIIQKVVNAIRSFKKQNNINKKISLYYQSSEEFSQVILNHQQKITNLASVEEIKLWDNQGKKKVEDYFKVVDLDFTLLIDKGDGLDKNTLLEKINKQHQKLSEDLLFIEKRLSNSGFVNNVKPEIIAKEKERLEKIKDNLAKLEEEKAKL